MIITFLLFPIFLIVYYLSIVGFGKFFVKICNLNNQYFDQYKNIEFIFGLVFIGLFSILINLISNISDVISNLIIFLGIIFYILFFFNNDKKKEVINLIFIIILISVSFSFYALINDDFNYHYKTILNFKDYNTFQIEHGQRISYNSHWLLINAAYYLKYFPASIFCITSIFYSLTLFDFYKSIKRNYLLKNYISSSYSFFVLVFLVGVLNQYKEYGTDFPGQILLFYFCLLYFENYHLIFRENNKIIIFILGILSLFAFSIKISNGLIFIFLIFIFFKFRKKIDLFLIFLCSAIPTVLWFLQNFIISKCVIWPISITCIKNIDSAKYEMILIERFAKGDITAKFEISGINWISMWFSNHSTKLLETYGLYFVIMLFPVLFFYLRKRGYNYSIFSISNNIFKSKSYISFLSIILISNLIWFVQAPAYRFGVFYNLNLIIILLLFFWYNLIFTNKKIFFKTIKILLFISLVFFLFNNITKYKNYIDRHGLTWPNLDAEFIDR